MKKIAVTFLALMAFNVSAGSYVNGYYKSNGTYVNGYYKSSPNSTVRDNYTYKGNTNPYTGAKGSNYYKSSPSSSYYSPSTSLYNSNSGYKLK